MTTLQSGYIATGTNTPTKAQKQVAVDNPYVEKESFIAYPNAVGLGITAASAIYTSGELDRILLRASSEVNRYCARWFDTQTIDETKTGFRAQPFNPQLTTVVLKNRPYQTINSIYIQVLQWFIQVLTTGPNSYLQDFPDLGYYKIVPLLSSSGTGSGSPIPAAILDKVALGVLWTNYTFGYGTPLKAQVLTPVLALTSYQAPLGNRLFAPSQPLNVYDNTVLVPPASYTVDYPNGIITFKTALVGIHVITADFTTNESIPADIKEATVLLACYSIGQGSSNPLGVSSYGIQTYNVSFGDKNILRTRAEALMEAYKQNQISII